MNYTIQMKKRRLFMNALSTLFPVFFMIILGMIARIKGFISPEQKVK